jgi:ribose 1,5-bisphosphokinase PhnN
MPTYQQTIVAKERSKRIREARDSVRERLARQEDAATIREYLKHGTDGGAA